VEKSLGVTLPGSYKRLIDMFGASRWNNFLRILSPFDENPNLNLLKKGETVLEADRITRSQFAHHYPLPLHPELGGLLPRAITVNGDTLYFITAAAADDWPTVIKDARSPEFEVNFLPPALLVHHFAIGSLRSTILPGLGELDY